MLLCGSELRPPRLLGPSPLVRLANDTGFEGLALDGGVTERDLPPLVGEALAAGLTVPWLFGPIAEGPLPPGKRLPHLASTGDKEERLEAVKRTKAMMDFARGLGIAAFALDLGRVDLGIKGAVVRRHFDRRELDEGEPGNRRFRRALEERKARSEHIVDACRWSLERLVAHAEREGTRLAVLLARSPWGAPSPREAQVLLQDFRGAPLGLVMAPARRATLETLGLAGPAERWPDLDAQASLLYLTDAVGASADLAPGLGTLELEALAAPPRPAPVVVSGRRDTTRPELESARELADRLSRARERTAATTTTTAAPPSGP